MSFLKRLYFFLFGLSIGIMILIFVINKKDTRFNYTPNKRVLNDIYKKNWVFSNQNNAFSKDKFLSEFDVNFSKSNTKIDTCKVYYIESKKLEFSVQNCEKNAFFVLNK
ncbi:MAG: DUF4258 domain-containing protein [Flavobacteriales bacterium]|jgi:hypothetical protein|nr:hypothetical protein [bacterium]|tara:strand:- start:1253 stop:1579 length:327 start_codon:yes stop_codon:yes gene_type:complete